MNKPGGSAVKSKRTVFWVIPAYNEEASIGDLIDLMVSVSAENEWSYEIIIVDDGSADGTGDIARAKAAEGLPVVIERNEPNQGLGRTMRTGLRSALSRATDDDVIVSLDADLTQDPSYAPALLARIDEGHDVVIASRYRPGARVEGLSTFRRFLSYGASAAVALVRPVRGVRDYSCGFRAYRVLVIREGFERYGDDFVSEKGFACQLEIAERLRDIAAFVEVPFVLRYQDKRKAFALKILPTIGAYFRVIAKVAASGRKPIPVATLGVAFSSVALGALGQMLFRTGARGLAGAGFVATLTEALQHPSVLLGLALYAVSSALWLGVLSRMEVAVAYPLGASGYVLVVVLAWLSGEGIPAQRWMGVGLIMVGVMLVGWLGVAPRRGLRA